MNQDIYSAEKINKKHSFRYIYIKAKNVVGILNRISSLMRRKRYNMEEVSLTFGNDGNVYFVIAIDGEIFDIEIIINQISKLHDVLDAFDITGQEQKLFYTFQVKFLSESQVSKIDIKPLKIISEENFFIGIYLVSLKEFEKFQSNLINHEFEFSRRLAPFFM